MVKTNTRPKCNIIHLKCINITLLIENYENQQLNLT